MNEGWTGDPELAIQAQQRHLLQVGYTDLALGRILDKLHETGLYDRSLVVVVADHGVSFRPHGERRRVEEGNMEEIAFVPLFVKPPGQTDGAIVDDHARTIDILPTIADILGVEVPWKTDGRSLLAGGGDGPDVRVGTSSGDVVVGDDEELVERRARSSRTRSTFSARATTSRGSSGSARVPTCSGVRSTGSPGRSAAARRSRATARATTTRWRPSPRCASMGGS